MKKKWKVGSSCCCCCPRNGTIRLNFRFLPVLDKERNFPGLLWDNTHITLYAEAVHTPPPCVTARGVRFEACIVIVQFVSFGCTIPPPKKKYPSRASTRHRPSSSHARFDNSSAIQAFARSYTLSQHASHDSAADAPSLERCDSPRPRVSQAAVTPSGSARSFW